MSEHNMLHLLKKSKLFQGLEDGDLEEIFHFLKPIEREYCKNDIIINQGEPVSKIGILIKGNAISSKYHYNGDVQILRLYQQGEVFSLDAVNTSFLTSPVTMISQTDCAVMYLSYLKIFETELISSEAKKIIMSNCSALLSNELIRLMYKIDVLSKRTLQERILTYLSLIREKNGCDSFDISMNQEQFAQYLCVNRSVLSKELNRMRKERMIDYKGNRYTLY
ncbi:MAG: Crp/Fnr family transcriptional regulator [Bacillota bacterium]